MTIRMSFLVSGKGAQSGVTLGRAAAQPRGEEGNERRLEITDDGNPGEGYKDERGEPDENRGSQARAASTQASGHELCSPDRAERAAGAAPDCFVPLAKREAETDSGARREKKPGGQSGSRAREPTG